MKKLVLPAMRKKIYWPINLSLGGVFLINLVVIVLRQKIELSILMGGIMWFIPQGYMAFRLFHRLETSPKRMMFLFYQTEVIKLCLIGFLFIVFSHVFLGNKLELLVGYLVAQCLYWVFQIF